MTQEEMGVGNLEVRAWGQQAYRWWCEKGVNTLTARPVAEVLANWEQRTLRDVYSESLARFEVLAEEGVTPLVVNEPVEKELGQLCGFWQGWVREVGDEEDELVSEIVATLIKPARGLLTQHTINHPERFAGVLAQVVGADLEGEQVLRGYQILVWRMIPGGHGLELSGSQVGEIRDKLLPAFAAITRAKTDGAILFTPMEVEYLVRLLGLDGKPPVRFFEDDLKGILGFVGCSPDGDDPFMAMARLVVSKVWSCLGEYVSSLIQEES